MDGGVGDSGQPGQSPGEAAKDRPGQIALRPSESGFDFARLCLSEQAGATEFCLGLITNSSTDIPHIEPSRKTPCTLRVNDVGFSPVHWHWFAERLVCADRILWNVGTEIHRGEPRRAGCEVTSDHRPMAGQTGAGSPTRSCARPPPREHTRGP